MAGPASGIGAQVGRRWQAIDRLLPEPAALPAGCGAELAVASGGQPVAIGRCEHWRAEPGSLELSWGAARRFRLTAQVAGPDIGGALDRLLSQWHDHLASVPGAGGEDTAATVTWPSRDIDGVLPLLRHGLMPLTVIAARSTVAAGAGRAGRADPDGPAGVRIRRAGPADIEAVTRLGQEVIRYDGHFGMVSERPSTAAAMRREAAALLARPQPWVWLAERDATPVGLLAAEGPETTGWIAPLTRLAPACYLGFMFTAPGERGGGVGAALVARLHHDVAAAGVPVTLLHYGQVNPLSVPFWSQQGYRPLWLAWEAWPAAAVR
ncbi:MAG TPA: GNAT family N-acetyltransferase [Streptosporangiaceae bacterium]